MITIKEQSVKLSFLLFCIGLFSCSDPAPKEEESQGPVEIDNYKESPAKLDNSTENDVEFVIGAGELVYSIGKDLIENKRRKDSIQLSKKERMFVYQLGVPFKHEKEVVEAYLKLSDTKGVYVFKKSRKEYLLIKYENKEEQLLDLELDDYKLLHDDEVIGEIKKKDLMQECGKREKLLLSGKLKSRKNKVEIDCLTCAN